MPDVGSLPAAVTAAAMVLAGALVWWAGGRLERLGNTLAGRTGLGGAFTGMILLAGATSLPELATTVTAIALLSNPTLAVHNLLGSIALQTAVLVLADLAQKGRGALTYFSPRFVLLVEGVGLLMLLQLAIAGAVAKGAPAVFGVSAWSVLLLIAYVLSLYLVYRYRGRPRWTPTPADDVPNESSYRAASRRGRDGRPLSRVWLAFAGLAVLVLIG